MFNSYIYTVHTHIFIPHTFCLQKQSSDSCEKDLLDNKTVTKYIKNFQHCDCPHDGFDLCKNCKYVWPYIEHHLNVRCKKNDCTLW